MLILFNISFTIPIVYGKKYGNIRALGLFKREKGR
jgi:hypothetical protein